MKELSTTQQERREANRIDLKARVRARLVDSASGLAKEKPACAGWTRDVSVGGVRFSSRKALPLNSTVELDVECTHPMESFHLRGQVGWLCQEGDRGYSLGVFVCETDHERLIAWRRLLERRRLTD